MNLYYYAEIYTCRDISTHGYKSKIQIIFFFSMAIDFTAGSNIEIDLWNHLRSLEIRCQKYYCWPNGVRERLWYEVQKCSHI